MTDVIILDCNGITHALKHTMRGLSTVKHYKGNIMGRVGTGIIFGFLKQIIMYAELIKPKAFVFTWDTKGSLRTEIYPNYKANRGDKSDKDQMLDRVANPQVTILRDTLLTNLGFNNVFFKEGYEADDIIAAIAKKKIMRKIVIVSRDNDLWQLLDNWVSIYDPMKKKFFTNEDFENKYGIPPYLWAGVKTLAGCATDNVKGIPGIGVKTAVKYFRGELKKTTKAYKNIKDCANQYKNNLDLVYLPFNEEVFEECRVVDDTFNLDAFIEVCEEFKFNSLLSGREIRRWTKAFVSRA